MYKKDYLICYDIALIKENDIKGQKRLNKVAKYLEKVAFRIQYSIFYLPSASKDELEEIVSNLKELISTKYDDVKIYTIKNNGYKAGIATDLNEPFILI